MLILLSDEQKKTLIGLINDKVEEHNECGCYNELKSCFDALNKDVKDELIAKIEKIKIVPPSDIHDSGKNVACTKIQEIIGEYK